MYVALYNIKHKTVQHCKTSVFPNMLWAEKQNSHVIKATLRDMLCDFQGFLTACHDTVGSCVSRYF